jgi:hypothetical protein
MPKKKHPESPEEQSARFVKDAEELISAGKLDPEEGTAALNRLLRKQRTPPVKR